MKEDEDVTEHYVIIICKVDEGEADKEDTGNKEC